MFEHPQKREISINVSRVLRYKGVPRVLQGRSKVSLKGVPRVFGRCFEDVSRVVWEIQGSYKGVV